LLAVDDRICTAHDCCCNWDSQKHSSLPFPAEFAPACCLDWTRAFGHLHTAPTAHTQYLTMSAERVAKRRKLHGAAAAASAPAPTVVIDDRVEAYDGTYDCLICYESVRIKGTTANALQCSECRSNPYHSLCAVGTKWVKSCPQCYGTKVVVWNGELHCIPSHLYVSEARTLL
jgi:hypothetical protein